jgi:ATP-binding cassette, subfamily B, bacterial
MKDIKSKLPNFDKELVNTFWWVIKVAFKGAFWQSTIYMIASIIRIAINLFSYYATAHMSGLLVEVITRGTDTGQLKLWFYVWSVTSIVGYALYRLAENMAKYIYYETVKWTTLHYHTQLCTMDMADFYDKNIRNEINRLNSGIDWKLPNSATSALAIVQSTINTIATIVTVGIVAWWLVPIFVLMMIPYFIYESRIAKINWFMWGEEDDSRHIYWGIQSLLEQAKKQFEIRALTAQHKLLGITTGMNRTFYGKQTRAIKKLNGLGYISVVSQFLREAMAQAWLLSRAIAGKITLEQYFFYMAIVFRLDGAISGLFSSFAQIQDGLKFSSDFRKFLSHTPKLVDLPDAVNVPDQPPYIELRNATFTYPGANKSAFKNLNLSIAAGEKVALVGENGAGKSTIIKLLMRFYKLDSGQLFVNGIDIQELSINSWYKQVATLFQDFNQYPLTIKDNISISGESGSLDAVVDAAKLAGSDRYISDLKNGYDTYLDPAFKDGVEPSGGMWQRIALARAFYRNANMIILDEPTSAIDAKAEYEIFNNIFSVHDEKTALIVSHRFSTVRKADRIIVIDGGKIVENGTHKDLLAKKGLYAEMFNTQAEGYK